MSEKLPYFSDNEEWAENVATGYLRQKIKSGLLSLDIDDTILDSKGKWYELYITLAKKQRLQEIVTFETFTLSPRAQLAPLVENYVAFKTQYMLDQQFNASMSLLKTSHSLLEVAKNHNIPHGYLSTRSEKLGEVTCQNLQAHNFPPAPVLLRAEHIPYGDTIGFKVGARAVLRAALDNYGFYGTHIYHVDDYKQLTEELNENVARVKGIHFRPTTSWSWVIRECLGSS